MRRHPISTSFPSPPLSRLSAPAPPPPGARAFANAVPRSFAGRGTRGLDLAPPRDPTEAPAPSRSSPPGIAERGVLRFGRPDAEALRGAINERPPLTLRANTLRISRDALAARLTAEEGLAWRPTQWAPEGLVVGPGGAPGNWGAFADGSFVVQDEASMLVARLLEPRPGETSADVCAAPGTKTTHLAELMQNRGRVLAFDPQPGRLERVREAAGRLGITIVEPVEGTVEALASPFRAACDGVLVDAPCSNLGVLRRNPDVKWRRQPADLATNAERQGRILDAAATMGKPGGRLVYATGSLGPEENEAVVQAFLAAHPEIRVDPPGEFPLPIDPDGTLRCLPHRHGTDGFTAVRFRRSPGRGITAP